MNRAIPTTSIAAMLLPLALAGCGSQPGSVNVEAFTAERRQAVNDAGAQMEAIAAAVAATIDALDAIEADGDLTTGTCPIVTVTQDGAVRSVALQFPDGCMNPYYGELALSGSIEAAFNTDTRSFEITFNDFATTETTTSGTMSLVLQRSGAMGALTGDIDLAFSGIGAVTGAVAINVDVENGVITIVSADLSLTGEQGESLSVEADNLVSMPIDNGAFIPESGSLSFGVPNDGPGPDTITIVVTFSAQSPIDGTVTVQIGASAPVEYQFSTMET